MRRRDPGAAAAAPATEPPHKPLSLAASDAEISAWYQTMLDAEQDVLLVDMGPMFNREGARQPGRNEQIMCGGRNYDHGRDAERWWWMRDRNDAVKQWLKANGRYRPFGSEPIPSGYQPSEVFCYSCRDVSGDGELGLRPEQSLIVSWVEPAEPGNLVVADLCGDWAVYRLASPRTLTTDQDGTVDLLDGDKVYRVTAIYTPAPHLDIGRTAE